MKSAKIGALFQEFPFLSKHVDKNEVTSVRVSRIDETLLDRSIGHFFVFLEGSGYEKEPTWTEKLLILDRNGECLFSLGGYWETKIDNRMGKSAMSWLRRWFTPDETIVKVMKPTVIADALYWLEKEDKLDEAFFVLSFILPGNYDSDLKWQVLDKGALMLYKPPKNFNLPNWLREQKRRKEEELAREIADIDAEGSRDPNI